MNSLGMLISIPAVGTEVEAFSLLIEVKCSDNAETKTGLKRQFAERYMSQLGTKYGVFVVVWLTAPNMTSHRPVWPTIDDARRFLADQAEEARKTSGGTRYVAGIFVDASLR